jgi:hypothetical protein
VPVGLLGELASAGLVVRAAASSENSAARDLVPILCSGELRSGLALGGALPGEPLLVARQADGGWRLDGHSPFVSGWGRIDVVHTTARTDDGRVVWGLVDPQGLAVRRLGLVALNATATVRAEFDGTVLPGDRVTAIHPYREAPTPPQVLRVHAALALGVASRCCRLIGASPLDDELRRYRAELDQLDPETIEAARAWPGELATRAAGTLLVSEGSSSLQMTGHAQRLAREALFALVYALRPRSRRRRSNGWSGSPRCASLRASSSTCDSTGRGVGPSKSPSSVIRIDFGRSAATTSLAKCSLSYTSSTGNGTNHRSTNW